VQETKVGRWNKVRVAGSVVTHDGGSRTPVPTARAPQHVSLFEADACKHLCILTDATKPSPFSALCSQLHRRLAVLVPSSHLWVHCPRASNGLLPPRSYLAGYVRWYARSDSVLPFPPSDNHSNSFQLADPHPYRDRQSIRNRVGTRGGPARQKPSRIRSVVVPQRHNHSRALSECLLVPSHGLLLPNPIR